MAYSLRRMLLVHFAQFCATWRYINQLTSDGVAVAVGVVAQECGDHGVRTPQLLKIFAIS